MRWATCGGLNEPPRSATALRRAPRPRAAAPAISAPPSSRRREPTRSCRSSRPSRREDGERRVARGPPRASAKRRGAPLGRGRPEVARGDEDARPDLDDRGAARCSRGTGSPRWRCRRGSAPPCRGRGRRCCPSSSSHLLRAAPARSRTRGRRGSPRGRCCSVERVVPSGRLGARARRATAREELARPPAGPALGARRPPAREGRVHVREAAARGRRPGPPARAGTCSSARSRASTFPWLSLASPIRSSVAPGATEAYLTGRSEVRRPAAREGPLLRRGACATSADGAAPPRSPRARGREPQRRSKAGTPRTNSYGSVRQREARRVLPRARGARGEPGRGTGGTRPRR